MQALESRAMMASIPVLNSLPNAARSLYLDFDGHFQATWNRTDSNQTYTNVNAGQFNLDNVAGFSDAEAGAMQKIWQTVAEDYAPFNINVTTVAPASFANGVAMRVVMCGDVTAQLQTGRNTSVALSGNRFITDDNGLSLVDTSGYAAVGSFNNAEPNVVYVFAKYINTWGTTDSEGRIRDLQYVMATTATHEAGHAFGLEHHHDLVAGTQYNNGDANTTPIMGSNTQGDRSVWSKYTNGDNVLHDNLLELTNTLGARADDYSNSYSGAGAFVFTNYNYAWGPTGTVKGIVGTQADTDWFRITSGGANFNFNLTTVQYANLDARITVYRVHSIPFFGNYFETVTTLDPGIPFTNPFVGLGASGNVYLAAGNYAVVVRSHGAYGDLGNYTLTISQPIFYFPTGGVLTMSAGASTSGGTTTTASPTTSRATTSMALMTYSAGSGEKTESKKTSSAAADRLFAAWS